MRLCVYCFFVFLMVFFSGCYKQTQLSITQQLHSMLPPQNVSYYVTSTQKTLKNKQEYLKDTFLTQYKSPLELVPKVDANVSSWALNESIKNTGFGENHLENSKEWIEELAQEADFTHFPSVKEAAVIVQTTSVRGLPTNKPRFFNPNKAGEGHPFDYWQNSLIFANTPVLITHYSKTKEWAFIESSFVSGFVPSVTLAKLKEEDRVFLQNNKDFAIVLQDKTPIYDSYGNFLHMARVGMFYPLLKKNEDSFEALVFLRDNQGFAFRQKVTLPLKNQKNNNRGFENSFSVFPLEFTQENLALLSEPIMGEKYGWGGLYENRDCSAFLRDILGNFGIWLPRNSAAQMLSTITNPLESSFVNLQGLTRDEKLAIIQNRAVPFLTLLGMNGHVMLYLGNANHLDEAGNYNAKSFFALHDVWGIRTKDKKDDKIGRAIIGGVVITPLNFGEGLADDFMEIPSESLLIERINSLKILVDVEDVN